MKSLQEVLKAKECCANDVEDCKGCPYFSIHDSTLVCCEKRYDDEQYYLKQYAENAESIYRQKIELQQKIERFQNAYIMLIGELADLADNPPLSWAELRRMKDKPIFVTYGIDLSVGDWLTVYMVPKADYSVIYCTTCAGVQFWLYKSEQGKMWQAYRKEL